MLWRLCSPRHEADDAACALRRGRDEFVEHVRAQGVESNAGEILENGDEMGRGGEIIRERKTSWGGI